ncbi:MAG: hypothetical protein ACR2G4_02880 [Pyrinomonadaceae bacterium]
MEVTDYGRYYWVVKLANGQEWGVYGDRLDISPDGSLTIFGGGPALSSKFINLSLAAGSWQFVYAASEEDGAPLAVHPLGKRKSTPFG